MGHLKSKNPEFSVKFEQQIAEVMALRVVRRSLIQKAKEEKAEILNSVNSEADHLSWSPAAMSGTSDTFEIGKAKEDFDLKEFDVECLM